MSASRPKRAPDLPFPSDGASSADASNKKPRFDYRNPSTLAADAPEDDAILEADEIGKAQRQVKRNAVKIDGYDSDSSEENFDARAEEKARAAKAAEQQSKDADDADMFADLEDDFKDGDDDEELGREGGKAKKKSVTFLDDNQIEGQVADSKSGGHVSADFSLGGGGGGGAKGKGKVKRGSDDDDDDSSSDDESGGDDEQRDRVDSDMDEELGAGAKKKHAPKLDAFNMKAENEEGRFDDQGNYVRKANDPDAVHDTWLEGLSKKDMKKARAAEEKREEERRRRAVADDQVLTSELLAALIVRLDRAETVLEALARLGTGKKKNKPKPRPKWQQKNKRKQPAAAPTNNGEDAMDVDPAAAAQKEDPAERRRRDAVEALTGAADQLLTRGQTDIYDQEREALVRQYRRETGDDWVDPPKKEEKEKEEEEEAPDADAEGETRMWEYRWADARDGGERHGPYDGRTMKAWGDAGYFGEGVEFRRVGEAAAGWERVVDFL
ncbi:lin1 family protein [Diplodia corticola]|uniref:Lin1 family protein n=1 Tax=Diplodia corticola TaxID=236234 RepID=A0A1J9QNN7_9PEZI|nr:lin1 family protein [Diplodia corticola]OJD30057.1 lin1 family protein [Diplodia corticola]